MANIEPRSASARDDGATAAPIETLVAEPAEIEILPPEGRDRAREARDRSDLPDISRAFALREAAFRLTAIQLAPAKPSRDESLDVEPVVRPRRAPPPMREPPKPRFRAVCLVGCAALLALTGLILDRETIAGRAPLAGRLYALAGIPVRPLPLKLDRVAAHVAEIDGRSFLVVEGDIANPAARRVAVPGLALSVKDNDGVTIYQWEAATGLGDLEPGRAGRFRARLAAPPPNGRNIVVRFAAPATGRGA